MAYLDTVAGTARKGGISTAAIDAGALSADASGRAVVADGFFNAATSALKFAAQGFAHSLLALRAVEAHTAGDTLLSTESGSIHTNTGASGAITLVLPAATVGQEFFFIVGAAQELRIDPAASETISLPSTGAASAAGAYITANAVGETVHVMCGVAGTWNVMGFTGTWTAV